MPCQLISEYITSNLNYFSITIPEKIQANKKNILTIFFFYIKVMMNLE